MVISTAAIKAALLATGISAATASAAIRQDAPVLATSTPQSVALPHLPKPSGKMSNHALLLQMDQRLRRIEQMQEIQLRGYMTGGVYR